jgi:hypothetical protein
MVMYLIPIILSIVIYFYLTYVFLLEAYCWLDLVFMLYVNESLEGSNLRMVWYGILRSHYVFRRN